METYDDRTFEQKLKDFGRRAGQAGKDAVRWVKEHPDDVAKIGMGTAAFVGALVKVSRVAKQQQEIRDERRRVWDPAMGQSVYSRRPLNGAEKLEFEERVRSGQGRASALESMGLLDKRK